MSDAWMIPPADDAERSHADAAHAGCVDRLPGEPLKQASVQRTAVPSHRLCPGPAGASRRRRTWPSSPHPRHHRPVRTPQSASERCARQREEACACARADKRAASFPRALPWEAFDGRTLRFKADPAACARANSCARASMSLSLLLSPFLIVFLSLFSFLHPPPPTHTHALHPFLPSSFPPFLLLSLPPSLLPSLLPF